MTEETPKKPSKSATAWAMDYLAQRNHSEKELKEKLKKRFSSEEISKAIEYLKTNNWLAEESVLSEKWADSLGRKNKGIQYINQTLREKGLPQVKSDPEMELEKALRIVKNKYSRLETPLSKSDQMKIGRFLMSRGFENEIIRKVIYEKLRN